MKIYHANLRWFVRSSSPKLSDPYLNRKQNSTPLSTIPFIVPTFVNRNEKVEGVGRWPRWRSQVWVLQRFVKFSLRDTAAFIVAAEANGGSESIVVSDFTSLSLNTTLAGPL